jgi:hypothetical protein
VSLDTIRNWEQGKRHPTGAFGGSTPAGTCAPPRAATSALRCTFRGTRPPRRWQRAPLDGNSIAQFGLGFRVKPVAQEMRARTLASASSPGTMATGPGCDGSARVRG